MSAAGDVNGDGYDDIIVGAHLFDNGQSNEGRVFVYHGSASGPSPTSSWTTEVNGSTGEFGKWVANAGDVNADGYDDVIVGANRWTVVEPAEGRAFVYMGSASGLATTAAWSVESNQAFAELGSSVAGAGDVNGDGYDDVIVGVGLFDGGQYNEGRALVYYGSATGLSTTAGWTYESNQSNALFGWSVAGAGDVNADGFGDVVVGAAGFTSANSGLGAGSAFLFLGSPGGLLQAPNRRIDGDGAAAAFGWSVAGAGDVDRDGYADVIIGAPYAFGEFGGAFIYLGSAIGLSPWSAWSASGSYWRNGHFGNQVGGAGDVNGDCYADVIVGADVIVDPDLGASYLGRAFVYLGSANGPPTTPDWTAVGPHDGSRFGWSLGTAGDVNADGFDDIVAGAYGYDNGETDEGSAFAYLGSDGGPCGDPPTSTSRVFGRVFEAAPPADCMPNASVSKPGLEGRFVVAVPDGGGLLRMAATEDDGIYSIEVAPGDYTISLVPKVNWDQTCPTSPESYPVTASESDDVVGVDFGSDGLDVVDLRVDLMAVGTARNGFSTTYAVTVTNVGGGSQDALIEMDLPTQTTYEFSSNGGKLVDNTVMWYEPAFEVDGVRNYTARITIDPGATPGTSLINQARVTPVGASDVNPGDNADDEQNIVGGSLDPNDKLVSPEGAIAPDQRLTYRVRFQNVGTLDAINIAIRDTLDPNLDLASLALTGASHAMEYDIAGREIVWYFPEIHLPDSTTDEAGSHGSVEFEISPVAGVTPGTTIENRAGIYFDFNPVVMTNTVLNTIADTTTTAVTPNASCPAPCVFELKQNQPNPFGETTRIAFRQPAAGEYALQIFNVAGEVVRRYRGFGTAGEQSILWDGGNSAGKPVAGGVYFYQLQIGPNTVTKRMTIIR
ncbi:MAG: FG-GAP-like repeat-containing protein [bacterium]